MKLTWGLGLTAVFSTLLLAGTPETQSTSTASAPVEATVTVTVVDAVTGAVVPDAMVMAGPRGSRSHHGRKTDAQGVVTLTVSPNGPVGFAVWVGKAMVGGSDLDPAVQTKATIRVAPVTQLHGRVTSSDGTPIRGALLSIAGVNVWQAPPSAISDNRGDYQISVRLFPLEYLSVSHDQLATITADPNFVKRCSAQLLARDVTANLVGRSEVDLHSSQVDLVLGPGITLSGQVSDANGACVPGAIVSVEGLGIEVQTGEDGRYALAAVPAQEGLVVQVSKRGLWGERYKLPVAPLGSIAAVPNLVLHAGELPLGGKVVDSNGAPVQHAVLQANSADYEGFAQAETNAEGIFSFHVPKGTFLLDVVNPAELGIRFAMSTKAEAGETDLVIGPWKRPTAP